MPARKPKSTEPAASPAVAAPPARIASAIMAQPPPTGEPPPNPPPLTVLDFPPKDANIPPVPQGTVTSGLDHAAPAPRLAELEALPRAQKDLANFTNYTETFGTTVPPYALLLQVVAIASAWSAMRKASADWDEFSVSQEAIAWTTLRVLLADLQTSFVKIKNGATMYPGLASLLGAKQAIARKGVATRTANRLAQAEGREPVHGKVGKRRQKAAEKAAYAAMKGPAGPVAAPPATPPAAPTVTVGTNGAAGSVPGAGAAAPASPANPPPANGATNGTPHP